MDDVTGVQPQVAYREHSDQLGEFLFIKDADDTLSRHYFSIWYVHIWPTGKITTESRVIARAMFEQFKLPYDELPEYMKELVWTTLIHEG